MAAEQVKAFLAKVKEDKELAKKLAEAQAAYKGAEADGIAKVVIPVAAAAGFNFTVEDFKVVADEQGEGEASAEELNAVAGGKMCYGDFGTDKICYDKYGMNF